MLEALGMEVPLTVVLAAKEAPKLQKCARYWHKGDSAWDKHWGAQRWGSVCTRSPTGFGMDPEQNYRG